MTDTILAANTAWTVDKNVKIWGLSLTETSIRSKANLEIKFYIPKTSASLMDNCDYLSLTLPYVWGDVLAY